MVSGRSRGIASKRPRLRIPIPRRVLIPLAVLLLPPLAWTILLNVLPTGWARARVVARLEEGTGRHVALGKLKVGVLGGLWLGDVEVASPTTPDDPWLKFRNAQIDVSLAQLLGGQFDPTQLVVDGLNLRIYRRTDGSFELADTRTQPVVAQTSEEVSACKTSITGLQFHATNAVITIVDESSASTLELTRAECLGVWEGHKITFRRLSGSLNGGTIDLAAELDGSAKAPTFEGQLRAEKISLAAAAGLLAYLSPVLAGQSGVVDGKASIDLYLKGAGNRRDLLKRTLTGRGTITLDPVRLDGAPIVDDLADAIGLPDRGRIGWVKSTFVVRDGRVSTDDLTIELARVPLVLTGWTDFDGRLQYRLKSDEIMEKLPPQARDFLNGRGAELKPVASFEVKGDLDRLTVSLDGRPIHQTIGTPADRQERLRALSRRLKDRLIR